MSSRYVLQTSHGLVHLLTVFFSKFGRYLYHFQDDTIIDMIRSTWSAPYRFCIYLFIPVIISVNVSWNLIFQNI